MWSRFPSYRRILTAFEVSPTTDILKVYSFDLVTDDVVKELFVREVLFGECVLFDFHVNIFKIFLYGLKI